MIFALVISLLVYTAEGKLMASQDVVGYTSLTVCQREGLNIKREVLKSKPDATVVFECVKLEKAVRS